MYMRHILLLSTVGAGLLLGAAFLLGQGSLLRADQPAHFFAHSDKDRESVRDGSKVTVRYRITLRDSPATTYSDTEQFVQGQHIILPALEQRIAGMETGEAKTFDLSVEEGFGPYDATKTQTVRTADLPIDAHEGDIVDDGEGRTAMVLRIFPETAVLDFNHPLAGKPLIVTLQIVQIENNISDEEVHPDVVIINPKERSVATQSGRAPQLFVL